MTYEIKVSELAEEFGVHRNTIRNWITSGSLPAKEGPGRRYLIAWEDYLKLCQRFGRQPRREAPEEVPPPSPNPGIPVNVAALTTSYGQNTQVVTTSSRLPLSGRDHQQVSGMPMARVHPPLQLEANNRELYIKPNMADTCITCGSCAGACPLAGVDGLDPRKIIRMAVFGLNEELLNSDWPWKCTLCGKCEEACPANVEIVQLMRRIRAKRSRAKVPQSLHKGVITCIEKGNNLGIPKEDFLALLTEMGNELQEDGLTGFTPPIDVRGSRLLVTVNSKEPFSEPENLFWWWKIFHAAGESWTIPSENWEGINWGLYSGDDHAMRTIVERILDNMQRLNCKALLLPECGHAYFSTRYCLERWYPEALEHYTFYTTFDLLLEYIHNKKITLKDGLDQTLTTYHDPCNYGRQSLKAFGKGYFEEAREIIHRCCGQFVEMIPAYEGSYCCGAGGGVWATPYSPERVYSGRIKARQIKETGAKQVVVACQNCRDQFIQSLNREFQLDVEIKYLWEMVADALVLPS